MKTRSACNSAERCRVDRRSICRFVLLHADMNELNTARRTLVRDTKQIEGIEQNIARGVACQRME